MISPKPKKELTIGVARAFVSNYKGINDPESFSYCDGHAISWLEDQAKKYGYGDRISTMNAACRIFLRNNKPAKKSSKKLSIEVIKFIGKNGAFASGNTEQYRTELVGANGKRRNINDWRSEGGYSEKQYADRDAKAWAALLGCGIVFVDKTAKKVAA